MVRVLGRRPRDGRGVRPRAQGVRIAVEVTDPDLGERRRADRPVPRHHRRLERGRRRVERRQLELRSGASATSSRAGTEAHYYLRIRMSGQPEHLDRPGLRDVRPVGAASRSRRPGSRVARARAAREPESRARRRDRGVHARARGASRGSRGLRRGRPARAHACSRTVRSGRAQPRRGTGAATTASVAPAGIYFLRLETRSGIGREEGAALSLIGPMPALGRNYTG